ncbi:ProQ/FINO family protein [Klebsiella pneumoniae]
MKYLATVAQGGQRFDLDGNPTGPIKTGHKAWARQMLAAYERQDNLF